MDDFAFRMGKTYSTILVEASTPRRLDGDRFPGRSVSDTLIAWLTEHPGAEVICRDRDSSYSRAAVTACPKGAQIADRWHLLQSLSPAVEQVCHQHRGCLKKHANAGRTVPCSCRYLMLCRRR
ncbi:transposase [Streptomyces sp. NPDC050636]|uniref:transposase n=1 Tax=Streptomyces sp. NPDC050636 TaxID=3154510 RepID=UPI003428999E